MEPLIGHSVDRTVSDCWKEASKKWAETMLQICTNFAFIDAPWEYLERTNSAIFAGALTASGMPAMPETYVMRNGVTKQGDQRVDVCAVGSNNLELIEFKLSEYDVELHQTIRKVDSRMKEAFHQVNNITGLHGKEISNIDLNVSRMTGVIGLPRFEAEATEEIIKKGIQQVISDIRNSSYPIKAWAFPPEYITRPSSRYGKKYYPGTFLVAQRA